MKKISIITFILLIGFVSLFAQNISETEESWKILQKAQQEFDANNFSNSMKFCQMAISQRKAECEQQYSILTKAVTPYQVRRVGENLNDVLAVLEERQEYGAIEIINTWVGKYSCEYFNESISTLREFLKKRHDYPEAYMLLAKIYRIEGEFNIALDYLEKARLAADLLEIPAEENDILFFIADIAEYTNDIPTQEKALLLIVQNDGQYKNETLKKAILRTSNSTKENNSSRMFELYRIDAISCLKAYFKLSKIYSKNKKYQEAYLTNLYGVIIGFTHLNELLTERESAYKFTNLNDFFKQVVRYSDIENWASEVSLWEGFYNIYDYGMNCGYARFAKDMITVLSQGCPDEYWKKASREKLNQLNIQINAS